MKKIGPRLLIAALAFLFTIEAYSQQGSITEMKQLLDKNIVEIDVEGERSTGLICGEYGGGLYVLTVRHVLGDNFGSLNNQAIANKRVTIPTLGEQEAECVYWSQFEQYDFAIFAVGTDVMSWYRYGLAPPDAREDEIVQFRIFENGLKSVQGRINSNSALNGDGINMFSVDTGGSVKDGASGSPVFTKKGIIGILITTDQGQKEVLPINKIVMVLKNKGKRKLFQLLPNYRVVNCICRFGSASDGIARLKNDTIPRNTQKNVWIRHVGYNKHPYEYSVKVTDDLGVQVWGNHPDANKDHPGDIIYCRSKTDRNISAKDKSYLNLKKIWVSCRIVDNLYLQHKGCPDPDK